MREKERLVLNMENVNIKEQNLRDKIYNQMVERSKNSNIEHIKYIKSNKL